MEISISERFGADLVALLGEPAELWVAGLPELARQYRRRWELTPDGETMHGLVAIVIPVRRVDGSPAALKLSWIDAETEHEGLALSTWNGRGAVRLLERHDAYGALLLERLDHSRSLLTEPMGEAVEVAGRLIRRLAVPAPAPVRRLGDIAQRWIGELPVENADLGRAVPEVLVDTAIAYCAELGPTAGAALVNEDLHYANVLRGEREPWLMIDPKPISGDPEFGLLPLLWNRFDQADVLPRFDALVEIAGLDRRRAVGWTIVRAVDNWLWFLANDGQEEAVACGHVARALAQYG